MNILSKLLGCLISNHLNSNDKLNIASGEKFNTQQQPNNPYKDFDLEQYKHDNEYCIDNFTATFDLEHVEGIKKISIESVRPWYKCAAGVPSLPEQILFKKATEHKKRGNMILAIECLKKANELLPHSSCVYQRSDYERLVNYLVQAGLFDEARNAHKSLDEKLGSRIELLKRLKESTTHTQEDRNSYQTKVIDPAKEEERDREEYYWLLENMQNFAPKSFGGYRRMKRQKTETYKKLIIKVTETGNDLNKVSFWQ